MPATAARLAAVVLLLLRIYIAASTSGAGCTPPTTATALLEGGGPAESIASNLLQFQSRTLAAARGTAASPAAPPSQAKLSTPVQKPQGASAPLASSTVSMSFNMNNQTGPTQLQDSMGRPYSRARTLRRDKVVLMLIETCPASWLLGIDRFYLGSFRTGIAKLLLGAATMGVGAIVWGFIDFCTVVINALQQREALHIMGISVQFEHRRLRTAYYLAYADVLLLLVWVQAGRFIIAWRMKEQRWQVLKYLPQQKGFSPQKYPHQQNTFPQPKELPQESPPLEPVTKSLPLQPEPAKKETKEPVTKSLPLQPEPAKKETKEERLARLRANASKSPHLKASGAPPPQ